MTADRVDSSSAELREGAPSPHRAARWRWIRAMAMCAGVVVVVVGVLLQSRRERAGVEWVDVRNPLDTPVADVHLHGVPLRRAVEALREQTGANIVVDWSDAKNQDIPPDRVVDVDLHAVTLRAALNAALSQATTLYVLDVQDGVVHVRRPGAPGTFVLRSYDVRDLIAAAGAAAPPGVPSAAQSTPGDVATPEDELADRLRSVLGYGYRTTLFSTFSAPSANSPPMAWPEISVWGGRLLVYDDVDGQRNVEQALAELRRATADPRLVPRRQ